MALSAGEYISGGEVRDADGRTVVIVEGGAGGTTFAQGTAAARPGTPVTNFYFATDTLELSIANAGLTAWQAIGSTSNVSWQWAGFAAQRLQRDNATGLIQTGNAGLEVAGGNLDIQSVGSGIAVKEGANAKQGTATLVAGTVTVANTSVTATSRIFLSNDNPAGTPGFLRVSARTAGTSFTILSSSGTDTSTISYEIFEGG